ncbi:unnamed protein product, partial [Rotaria magnacalcarata]
MKVNILFLLITFVNSQQHDFFSNLPRVGSSGNYTTDRCVEIAPTRLCASMPWNMTIYPNHLGHTLPEDADNHLSYFLPLVKIKCSKFIQYFLCSVHTPVCTTVPI